MSETHAPATPPSFKPVADLVSEELREVYAVWRELAGGSFAPTRAAIAPSKFKAHLASVFLINVIEGGADFRFVLGGQNLVNFMGGRHAGRLLSSFPEAPFYQRMRQIYARCVESKTPIAVGPIRTERPGREYLDIELVILPLSDNGFSVTSLMGAVHLQAAIVSSAFGEGKPTIQLVPSKS